MPKDILLL